MVRSSGPRTASTMQNSLAPSAAVSRAAASTSSVSRNGVASTGVSKRGGLGAEVAVLGAATRLGREDALHLDGVAAPGQPDLVGEGGERRDLSVGNRRQRRKLFGCQSLLANYQLVVGQGDGVESREGHHGRQRRCSGSLPRWSGSGARRGSSCAGNGPLRRPHAGRRVVRVE